MLIKALILTSLIKGYDSNPAAIALNTAKSGARLAGKILKNKAVRRIKSGSEHISAALRHKDNADSVLEQIKKFFKGTELHKKLKSFQFRNEQNESRYDFIISNSKRSQVRIF